MAPVSLKPNQKGATALVVVAVVMLVVCLLGCVAAMQKINSLNDETAAVEKQVRDSRSVAQTQRDSENRYLDTQAQIRCLESSVSTQAYVPTLLKQVERLGRSVHLRVMGVRPKAPDPNAGLAKKMAAQAASQGGQGGQGGANAPVTVEKPEPPKPYDELEVDFEMEGNYMDALDFLYKLTSFPKIVAVNNVEMTPDSDHGLGESPRLTIRINATAFVFKEASPSAGQIGPGHHAPSGAGAAGASGGTGNEAG
jgi:Tfp pilus assembly protein PilO